MSFQQVTIELLDGFKNNCILFFVTLILALPLGLLISLCSMSKFSPLRYLTKGLVWIIRGTPLMLQLIVVFYVPGFAFDIHFESRMTAAIIAFVINYAAYFSEIYRGGIQSIPKGQYEAGQVLGMTKIQIFFKVVLMQVVKRIIPPVGNEVITLVKDTSLARIISVGEIMLAIKPMTNKGLIWPLFYTGVFFLVFNGLVTLVLSWTEKKLDYYKG